MQRFGCEDECVRRRVLLVKKKWNWNWERKNRTVNKVWMTLVLVVRMGFL